MLSLLGVIVNAYDSVPVITRQIRGEIQGAFGEKVFATTLSKSIRLEEAIAAAAGCSSRPRRTAWPTRCGPWVASSSTASARPEVAHEHRSTRGAGRRSRGLQGSWEEFEKEEIKGRVDIVALFGSFGVKWQRREGVHGEVSVA